MGLAIAQVAQEWLDRLEHRGISVPGYVPLSDRCPEWATELLKPCRYKGIFGGRGSGKSHQAAEMLLDNYILNPDLKVVCIREVQKSLKLSAKLLIENKIQELGLGSVFDVLVSEIRCNEGKGFITFQGMQDHTAESIKSLEGFDIAWVEESQSLSSRSLSLLRPTIRKEGSEIWFTWNPRHPDDAIDQFLRNEAPENSIVIQVNYDSNPWFPDVLKEEMEIDRIQDIGKFNHIWLGEYDSSQEGRIFRYFARSLHVLSGENAFLCEYQPGYDLHLSIDFNHSPACAIAAQSIEGDIHIIREWYLENSDTFELAEHVTQWVNSLDYTGVLQVHGDASGNQRTANSRVTNWEIVWRAIASANLKGVACYRKSNPSIVDSVNAVNLAMKNEVLFINGGCVELIKDLEVLIWKGDQIDKGDIKRSHLQDCLRYLVWDVAPLQSGQQWSVGSASYSH